MKLAPPDVVLATTGYAIGSIPPFHWQPEGFRTFLDAALMNELELGVGAGVWGHEIIIPPPASGRGNFGNRGQSDRVLGMYEARAIGSR